LTFRLAFLPRRRHECQHGGNLPRKEKEMIVPVEPAKENKPADLKSNIRVPSKRGKLETDASTTRKKAAPPQVRRGTKTAKILQMLRRPDGASLAELTKATKWQAHSVRGFLSGAVKGKLRLKIKSTKRDDGTRIYRLPSQ
jgi:Protein of unknown function (DUF3489)